MRINDYPEKTTIDHEDKLVVDSISGTRSMSVDTVINEANDRLKKDDILQKIGSFENFDAYDSTRSSAPIFLAQRQSYGLDQETDENTYKIPIPMLYFEMLNHLPLEERLNHYGGRKLGQDAVSEAHIQAIKDGSFHDIYIGDYWVFNDLKYYVADVNYWMGYNITRLDIDSGIENKAIYTPHLLLFPESTIIQMKMYDSGDPNPIGYANCKWRLSQEKLDFKNTMIGYFGDDMLLDHMEAMPASIDYESIIQLPGGSDIYKMTENAGYVLSNFDIPSQEMIIGHRVDGYASNTNTLTQLRLLKYNPSLIGGAYEDGYWLRNISKNDGYSFLQVKSTDIGIYISDADGEISQSGIRPIIVIGYNPSSPEEGDQSEL